MGLIIHKRIVKPVSDVTFNISSAAAQQDRITIQQASSVNEITSTIEELNTSTKQVSGNAETLANQSKETLSAAYDGQNAIEESISEMNLIKSKVQAIAEEVLALSENTNQIGAIINVVEDIASKTDMLALNASIEAAKAGEQGKGFAVVAAEVRSLSDQSKKSTEKVATLIQEIQASVSSTVLATEEGAKKVDAGVSHILSAGSTINHAINTMKTNVEANKEIAIASHEGSMASQLVLEAMIHVNDSMKEATTATRESFRTVQKLLHLVDKRRIMRPASSKYPTLNSTDTADDSGVSKLE
ncbi:MAG: methyl-accepting chemotaxis protein [Nitrospinota bacterium]